MWSKRFVMALVILVALATTGLGGCAADETVDRPVDGGTGTLAFVANGEEFARDGFRSKDGWDIVFEHAYVSVSDVTAYQTDPPYDTGDGWDLDYLHAVELPAAHVVDLASPDADPAFVGEVEDAAAGHYNALSWSMRTATAGPAEGYTMVFVGTAEKDGATIDFVLRFEREVRYQGGDYVGDVRKGILQEGGSAEVEMTFHFDHFFGSAEDDPDDELNLDALGFDPLAALAVDGTVDVSTTDLESALSAEDFSKLEDILLHFGHVGEGHCLAEFLN